MNMAWTFTGGMCHRRAVRALDRACATGLRARAPSAESLLAFLCDAMVPHPWYRAICISGAESPARTPATAARARSGRGRRRGPAAIPGSARPPPGPRRARRDPAPADPARRKRPLAVLGMAGYGALPSEAARSSAWPPSAALSGLGRGAQGAGAPPLARLPMVAAGTWSLAARPTPARHGEPWRLRPGAQARRPQARRATRGRGGPRPRRLLTRSSKLPWRRLGHSLGDGG